MTVGSATVGYILNDGSFVLPKLSAGPYSLQVEGADVVSTAPSALNVVSGKPLAGVVVTVSPQTVVAGALSDGHGAPVTSTPSASTSTSFIPGALVFAVSGSKVVATGKVDSSGNYRVAGLTPGVYSFVAMAGGQAQTEMDNVVIAPGFNSLNLVMGVEAHITGKATLAAGAAATNLYVLATRENDPSPISLFSAAGDATGNFDLQGLPAGTYHVSFSSGINVGAVDHVQVLAGGHVNLGTVALQPLLTGLPEGSPNQLPDPLTAAGTNDDPRFPPGSTTPLYSAFDADVLAAQAYLRSVWLPAAYEGWGIEDSSLWNMYLGATSFNPNDKQFYGAGTQIVEGAMTPFGAGFRDFDRANLNENVGVRSIQAAVVKDVQQMFSARTLSCDQVANNGGTMTLALNAQTFPDLLFIAGGVNMNLLNMSGVPGVIHGHADTIGTQVIFDGAFNIPSNTAGGIGAAAAFRAGTGTGQQYDDNRHWDGSVTVTS